MIVYSDLNIPHGATHSAAMSIAAARASQGAYVLLRYDPDIGWCGSYGTEWPDNDKILAVCFRCPICGCEHSVPIADVERFIQECRDATRNAS